jgi:16S rRNA (uracil1498-N3)-methyltransferase
MSRHGHRFYVPQPLPPGTALELPRETARQITRVLRLRRGDRVTLFAGDGSEVPATIEALRGDTVTVRLGRPVLGRVLPPPPITLAPSLLKHDRIELVVEKATELGVRRIVPLVAQRCVVAATSDVTGRRLERWRRIAIEAAEQCGRASLPVIEPPRTLPELVPELSSHRAILLWEGTAAWSLAALDLAPESPVLLLVGPEGGWTQGEVEQLQAAGAALASLGPLTLRSETAALAAIAQVQALVARQGATPLSASASQHPPGAPPACATG